LSAIRRHPIITFFALAYVIAWGFVPFGSFGAFAPLVAALIVIPICQGVAGLKELGLRMIRWRVRWYWYAVAIGLPLAVHLAIVGLNVAAGAGVPSLTFTSLSTFLMVFAVRLVNPTDGPLGEQRGRPPGAAGIRILAACRHLDPGTAGSRLALAPLLLGAWRLAGFCPREWLRGDDGGDVLVHVAVQPHRRQHSAARHRARHRRKHPVLARLDRYGGVVGGCDRVGGLRLEGLAWSCACARDNATGL
jgi:hypothetical protein